MSRGVEAAEHGADVEQEERALQHRKAADQSGEHTAGGADLQRVAPAEPPRQRADRQRRHPHAEDEHADGERRQSLVWSEHGADDAGGRHQHRIVAARKRLGCGQHQRVAAGEAVAGVDVNHRVGESRHSRAPERDQRGNGFSS
jgi:hypothetical protein